jgi:hypothetical protein
LFLLRIAMYHGNCWSWQSYLWRTHGQSIPTFL